MNEHQPPSGFPENPLDEQNFLQVKANLRDDRGRLYADFKKTLTPNFHQVRQDMIMGWILIVLCLVFAGMANHLHPIWQKILVTVAIAKLLGFIINYLSHFFHEAAHYNLAKDRATNDRLANAFLGILVAQHINHYRRIHWQHHLLLGTTEDTEHSYYHALNFRFFFENLTGIRAIQIYLYRSKRENSNSGKSTGEPVSVKKQQLLMMLASAAFHLTVIGIFLYTHEYCAVAVWLLGFGSFYPLFGSMRQLLEHRSDKADSRINYAQTAQGKTNRMFNVDRFAPWFGSAGFDRHLLHHLEPQLSYTNFKEMEEFLNHTPLYAALQKMKTSYIKTFFSLLGK